MKYKIFKPYYFTKIKVSEINKQNIVLFFVNDIENIQYNAICSNLIGKKIVSILIDNEDQEYTINTIIKLLKIIKNDQIDIDKLFIIGGRKLLSIYKKTYLMNGKIYLFFLNCDIVTNSKYVLSLNDENIIETILNLTKS